MYKLYGVRPFYVNIFLIFESLHRNTHCNSTTTVLCDFDQEDSEHSKFNPALIRENLFI